MSVQTIESMAAWVKGNIENQPLLEDMAEYVGYSPFYCSVKFREYYGITFKQYLAKCRLGEAVCQLVDTKDSITAIAFRCGYSSAESLARACSVAFGYAPREIRKLPIDSVMELFEGKIPLVNHKE